MMLPCLIYKTIKTPIIKPASAHQLRNWCYGEVYSVSVTNLKVASLHNLDYMSIVTNLNRSYTPVKLNWTW